METVYMERGTPLPRYFPLPQFLLDVDISSTSKILFALLLNRANLSQKNVWEDEAGHVYCIYTIEDMAKDMNKGLTAIKNSLNELTREGLLERVQADFGRANHLYIKIPIGVDTVSKLPVIEPEKQQTVGHKSAPNKVSRLRAKCFTDKYMNNWTFENDNGLNPKMKRIKAYVSDWETKEKENCGLLLWGGVGTGKSYMAGCIANALLEEEVSVQMTNFAAILNDLNSHYSDRNEYIQSLCRNRLLIIDDLGMERGTDYGLEQAYNVIDARYRSNKPLIITTNLTLNEMQNETNVARKRIYDRVLAICIPMQIQGTHMRKIERENKFKKFTEGKK